VVFVDPLGVVVNDTGEAARDRGGEELPHRLVRLLVALEPEQFQQLGDGRPGRTRCCLSVRHPTDN
jgi:hypothetical protein